MILGLCALFVGFVMVSCGGSNQAVKDVEDLIEKVKEAKTADDVVDILKKTAEAQIAFFESNPSNSDIEAFNKASDALTKALEEKAEKDEDFQKAFLGAAMKMASDKELKELIDKAEKAQKDFEAKNGGDKKDDAKEEKE